MFVDNDLTELLLQDDNLKRPVELNVVVKIGGEIVRQIGVDLLPCDGGKRMVECGAPA